MNKAGMVNTGQLAREKYGNKNVYLAGFASFAGSVIAAEEWGAPMQEFDLPPARDGSIEAILHEQSPENRYVLFANEKDPLFHSTLPHRAIGVVYDPLAERYGNYVPSLLAQRYDAFIFLDETAALHPLHLHPDRHKLPATYPFSV
jgi:erythromycin esterase-like protein